MMNVLICLLVLYCVICMVMYLRQDSIVFMPESGALRVSETADNAQEVDITTEDGERLEGIYIPRENESKKIFVYFHGNAGNINDRAGKFKKLISGGHGLLAVNYRGYGHSTGAPSEKGLRKDAIATWGYAIERVDSGDDIILYGESLGTGVLLGSVDEFDLNPHMVVLEAPFISILRIGQDLYPWLPVRWLLRNHFDSINHACEIISPSLVIHGREDDVIPIAHGHAIHGALSGGIKAFRQIEDTGHTDFDGNELLRVIEEFREDSGLSSSSDDKPIVLN